MNHCLISMLNSAAKVLLNGTDVFAHLAAEFSIEIRQWFIKEQDLRFQHQGPGYRNALLLPAGKLAGQSIVEAFLSNKIQSVQGT